MTKDKSDKFDVECNNRECFSNKGFSLLVTLRSWMWHRHMSSHKAWALEKCDLERVVKRTTTSSPDGFLKIQSKPVASVHGGVVQPSYTCPLQDVEFIISAH
jgi:hypothetical protein